MTRAEMLRRMSSAELTDWMAYERVTGPLGPERQDLLHGIATAVLANANRSKRGKRAKPSDFIPRWDRIRKTPRDMLAAIRGINAALGGAERTEGGGADGDGAGRTAGRDRAGDGRPHGRRRRRRT